MLKLIVEKLDRLDGKVELIHNAVHRVEHGQDAARDAIAHLTGDTETIMLDLTRVRTEISELTTVVGSASALITELAQAIRDNAADQVAINEIADQLDTQGRALAEAVATNTPSEPEVPTEPEPVEGAE